MLHSLLNLHKLKQKVDPVELIEQLKLSHKQNKPTKKVHEILHLMAYKLCSKHIIRIAKMQYEYDDFVNDVYIYTLLQALKFDITKEGSSAFSYFTSVISNQIICLTKKHYMKYNAKKEYMNEMELEKKILISTDVYRDRSTK